MSKIRVLPDSLANKIAAGEVVERPASIVKELLENSIDAGAQRIEVVIESGGRRLIRLADDGEGMSRDDAILAFERHATSKLKTAEDLDAIVTLGFRGEALASIASVAKVRLRTQTAQDLVGTEIEISGGRMLSVRDCAFAQGAEFEIRDLFFNVPARRKFLKSEATENFHIANLVTHYALAHPQLSLTLINNGRESIRVTPASDLRERAYQLFGDTFISGLIEVQATETSGADELRVRGFVSSPSAVRTTRDNQYFFINGRFVRDKVLARALSEGYRAMIPAGVYPSAMLFVEIPPHEVDVNVHPAKTEVRFVRSTVVHDLVREAIRSAIGATKAAVTPFGEQKLAATEATPSAWQVETSPEPQALIAEQPPKLISADIKSGWRLPCTIPPPAWPQQQKIALEPLAPVSENPPAEPDEPAHSEALEDELMSSPVQATEETPLVAPAMRYSNRLGCLGMRTTDNNATPFKTAQSLTLTADEISISGQLHNSFILAADRAGLLIIDQHVAHERILFEQHWRNLRNRKLAVQRLLLPVTLDLTPAQAAAFDQVSPELEANGFELGRLSGRTIAVKAVPALLDAAAAQSLLIELLDAIEHERKGLSLDELHAEIAASLACRAAIKINMPLAPEKMRWLLDELLRMENPATCPHGRPIILRVTMREIEKSFQRS